MSIEARAKLLMDALKVPQTELEARSGISQQVWSKALNGRQRLNSTHLEFLCQNFADYALWLMTGNTTLGSAPIGAKYLEYFSSIALKYASAMAEYEYAIMIEKYLNSSEPIIDEFGIAGSAPMPSTRKLMQFDIHKKLMSSDFSALSKSANKFDDDNVKSIIDNFFYEKAFNELLELQNHYGKGHRLTVMLGRMLTEFLIPGSTSNVIEPDACTGQAKPDTFF